MAMKGLIGFERKESQLAFALMPFIVGFDQAQLPRLDAELAAMFEQYYQESARRYDAPRPSVHRVIRSAKPCRSRSRSSRMHARQRADQRRPRLGSARLHLPRPAAPDRKGL